MKVIVAGGSGWLGSALSRTLLDAGDEVVVLTRASSTTDRAGSGPRRRQWDGRTVGDWAEELDGAQALVNLAGEPIAPARWSPERKRALYASRIEPTTALVAALKRAQPRPAVLANVSAVGYYGDRGDDVVTENDPPGGDFLARLVVDWESAAWQASQLGVRVALLRLGIVFGPGGGALPRLALPFRFFVGGSLGSGKQWTSWVHIDDVVGLFRFALERPDVSGPMNVTAPEPATNRELARAIGQVLGRPSWMWVPGPVLRLALGELAGTLLAGQRALPAFAQRLGYPFREPALLPAVARSLGVAR